MSHAAENHACFECRRIGGEHNHNCPNDEPRYCECDSPEPDEDDDALDVCAECGEQIG